MWGVVWAWRGFFAGLDGVGVQNFLRMCHFANRRSGLVVKKSNQMGKLHNGGGNFDNLMHFFREKFVFLVKKVLTSCWLGLIVKSRQCSDVQQCAIFLADVQLSVFWGGCVPKTHMGANSGKNSGEQEQLHCKLEPRTSPPFVQKVETKQ